MTAIKRIITCERHYFKGEDGVKRYKKESAEYFRSKVYDVKSIVCQKCKRCTMR